ncbi:autotransporter domain-containing protein [Aurantiacibacter spongiae]|uniref:Autotransporter domain-containing protein n=1 Tax=Aurantiacibacter spongiae TaxID=2488860 RepID=A0A3N5DSU5_9SPHN|nr:autotransporter domain-containing protein [Aurantiacibacter spongiae]RPF72351.1 autotransporter domain-containing protein [Aurantiacibacter spongiae]
MRATGKSDTIAAVPPVRNDKTVRQEPAEGRDHEASPSRAALTTAIAFNLLAAGGVAAQDNDGLDVARVIVFGDSLADGGFYQQFLPLPPGEGSFTTNPDPVAPEVFAALLGYDLNPVYTVGGTNYAIGGARVALPTPTSPLAIPIASQIDNYLAAGGTFEPGDVVYIQGGGNDYFAFLAGGGTDPSLLTNAANILAAQVKRLEDAGADRIVTLAIQSDSAGLDLFNDTYEAALAANGANVLYFDTAMLFNEIVASPGTYGITNITDPACTGSSLTCGPEDYVEPNANLTYLQADDVHPAGITQRIEGQAIASLFSGFTLPGTIAREGQRAIRVQRIQYEGVQRNGLNPGGGLSLFGNASYDRISDSGAGALTQDAVGGTIGVAYDAPLGVGVGVALGYRHGDGSIAGRGDMGDLDTDTFTLSAFGRAALGPLHAIADATYGEGDVDLERTIPLGPALRVQASSTDTTLYGARGAVGFDAITLPVRIGPEIGLAYEKVKVDGFTEDGGYSTSLAVDGLDYESLTGRAGLVASAPLTAGTGLFARLSYVREFEDDDIAFTVTPTGAPVSYTSSYAYGDRDYGEFAAGISGTIGPVGVRAGGGAEFGRDDFTGVNVYAGVTLPF